MALTEETGNGKKRDSTQLENENPKEFRSISDVCPVQSQVPLLKKKFEGKDGLAYANILRSRNKFADAQVLYESIIENDSTNVEALIGKGICLQMQNHLRQAFACFVEAIRLDPQNACALTHCGVIYKDEGHLLEAAEVHDV